MSLASVELFKLSLTFDQLIFTPEDAAETTKLETGIGALETAKLFSYAPISGLLPEGLGRTLAVSTLKA